MNAESPQPHGESTAKQPEASTRGPAAWTWLVHTAPLDMGMNKAHRGSCRGRKTRLHPIGAAAHEPGVSPGAQKKPEDIPGEGSKCGRGHQPQAKPIPGW